MTLNIISKGEQPFFTEFLDDLLKEGQHGLMTIDWNKTRYPNLYRHKIRLIERFNRHFAFREIGAETVYRWEHQVKDKFDQIAPRFDHAYKLYDDETLHLDELTLGYVRDILYENNRNSRSNSIDHSEGDSKFRDTPTKGNSVINNPTTENLDTEDSQSSGNSTAMIGGKSREDYKYHDDHNLIEVNKLIDKYKNLDEEFINEFDELFIGILTVLE